MSAFSIHKDATPEWIKGLARKGPVFFPQRAGRSAFRFKPVQPNSELQFESYHPTLVPPGKKLTPADETLFRYRRNDAGAIEFEPVLDTGTRILAGVRPCDLKAIDLMDRVHREHHGDPHYLTRRNHTTLIAIDCLRPCDESCYCAAVGSLGWRRNADVFLTPVDAVFLVEVLSERGMELVHGNDFTACTQTRVEEYRDRAERQRPHPFGRQFAIPLPHLPALLARQWQSPVWERHVQHCFSCGSCNLVCPTCYCFDTRDDFEISDPNRGSRSQTWDACMLPGFAEVAGGHNFRPLPAARQRHRVKRKFEYLPQRFQEPSFCVGCGRCTRQCTASIDLLTIVNDLAQQGGERA
ncbi:MAG: 4Fe-4S dicluster domain-containing protein [Magnetococcales bacterium]|nr:4Fe-4S dicluster domain-containing protein [Magnetococcales bacterium]